MSKIDQIPLEIRIRYPAFISADNMARISWLIDRAVYEAELEELRSVKSEFSEIPDYIFDAVFMRLYRKAGSLFLIEEARQGSIVFAGFAAGLAYWLLDKTLGETIREAWTASDLHKRIKQFLLAQRGAKANAIGESVKKRLFDEGIEAGIETTEEGVVAYVSPHEDDELSKELQPVDQKPRPAP